VLLVRTDTAAVTVDGTSVQPGVVQLRVYTTVGSTVTESSRELAATDNLSLAGEYSLTWLNDGKTLAIGGHLYVRASDGQLCRIPWLGLISYPDLGNIVEPAIAW
jgi:hypothetical protein